MKAAIRLIIGLRGKIIDAATRGENTSILVTSLVIQDGSLMEVGSGIHYKEEFTDVSTERTRLIGGVEVQIPTKYVASREYDKIDERLRENEL